MPCVCNTVPKPFAYFLSTGECRPNAMNNGARLKQYLVVYEIQKRKKLALTTSKGYLKVKVKVHRSYLQSKNPV